MITQIISEIELDVKYKIFTEQKRLKAIKTIKGLLFQIDFKAETVPLEDVKKLSQLMIELKGKDLNEDEFRVIEDLIMK